MQTSRKENNDTRSAVILKGKLANYESNTSSCDVLEMEAFETEVEIVQCQRWHQQAPEDWG